MKRKILLVQSFIAVMALCSCGTSNPSSSSIEPTSETTTSVITSAPTTSVITSAPTTSKTSTSKPSTSSTLKPVPMTNANGIRIEFDTKGARINALYYGNLKIGESGFVAGRVANRIANSTFTLDGKTYNLTKNEGNNHLHGGNPGFGDKAWTVVSQTENQIKFTLHSPDGDQGYPGNLDVTTTYTLEDDGSLNIEYAAKCDKKTIFNPTNHLYMNLNGTNQLTNHELMVDADQITETNRLIPTGNFKNVEGTKYDFRTKKAYASSNNIDDNYCVKGEGFRKVAELEGKTSGIKMELSTDQPGVQIYNTNAQICTETQHYPDAVHHDNFPSIVLEANTDYYSKTTYKFTKTK